MNPKLPPHNLEAEQSVLGGLMLEREAWDRVQDILSADDLYKPAHKKIYATIETLYRKGDGVDILTITQELKRTGELDSVGGSVYIAELATRTLGAANIHSYAKIVHDDAVLRKLIHTSSDIIEKTYEGEYDDVDALINYAESQIMGVAGDKRSEGLVESSKIVGDAIRNIEEMYKRKQDITGIASGFSELDVNFTSGFQKGELIIVAARPSMGKTAFSLNLATHMALREKKKVAFFSLEMNKEQIMMRILASEARINLTDIRNGKIEDSSWQRLINAATQVSEAPLFIDESTGLSPMDILSKCRRLKAQHGIDIIMIDYLQLMELKKQVDNREREISIISGSLKKIAKELGIPVVALAQLNRGVESRSDRRPMLSDLRESGSIEQDADLIMMLYRDEYYNKDASDSRGMAEVIIGKHRNGPTGKVELMFKGQYGLFQNIPKNEGAGAYVPPPQKVEAGPRFGGGKPKNFASPGSDSNP